MVFQFEHMYIDANGEDKWDIVPFDLVEFKKLMSKWQKGLEGKGWNSLYLNNHDQPRMVSRFGNDKEYREVSTKMLATYLHMMQGTPYIYQGEEIGMTNIAFDTIEEYQDIESKHFYNEGLKRNRSIPDLMNAIHLKSRDNARTPMQWDDSANAGFTTGIPWLKVNPNYKEINAKQALIDKNSIFYYYQNLIKLRKEYEIIVYGNYNLILENDEQIYAYTRTLGNETLLVITNFSSETPEFQLPGHIQYDSKHLLISNYEVVENEDISSILLKPYEARVYLLR